MISHDDVPYADPEPFSEIIQECGCIENECASHGIALYHAHPVPCPHPAPVKISEATQHLVDGYSGYGS